MLLLLAVDIFWFDRTNNDYLTHVLRNRDINQCVIVGSSQLKWSVVDSLLCEPATILAMQGQFAYGTAAVVGALAEHGLLNGKVVMIDLHESDEIRSGHGQWWYFSEAFVEYRYASLADYAPQEWLPIGARVVRDLTHFSFNQDREFKWEPLDRSISHSKITANKDSIAYARTSFEHCLRPFSKPYLNSLMRLKELFARFEEENNCRIYVLIPPYPRRGCIEGFVQIFGMNRIVDLASLNWEYDDFHDNTHLNGRGAVKFTAELNRVLQADSLCMH